MKYPLAFANFWRGYPRRVGKKAAFKAWLVAIKEVEPEVLIKAVRDQLNSGQYSEIRYTPHPATWLRGERWEDEIDEDGRGQSRKFGEGTRTVIELFEKTGSEPE